VVYKDPYEFVEVGNKPIALPVTRDSFETLC